MYERLDVNGFAKHISLIDVGREIGCVFVGHRNSQVS